MLKNKKVHQKIGTFQELGKNWLKNTKLPEDEPDDIDSLIEDVVVKPATLRDFLITGLRNQIEERQRLLEELLSNRLL